MGGIDIPFDLETWLIICCAVGAGFIFYLIAAALSDGLGGRRFRRRLNAVRDESVRFQATFEQSVMGIAHVSPKGDWLRVNRHLCEMLGYSQAELRALRLVPLARC